MLSSGFVESFYTKGNDSTKINNFKRMLSLFFRGHPVSKLARCLRVTTGVKRWNVGLACVAYSVLSHHHRCCSPWRRLCLHHVMMAVLNVVLETSPPPPPPRSLPPRPSLPPTPLPSSLPKNGGHLLRLKRSLHSHLTLCLFLSFLSKLVVLFFFFLFFGTFLKLSARRGRNSTNLAFSV